MASLHSLLSSHLSSPPVLVTPYSAGKSNETYEVAMMDGRKVVCRVGKGDGERDVKREWRVRRANKNKAKSKKQKEEGLEFHK